ncbi:MAG TPA: carboxypeptidase regulatory-like domain-containing protein [Chloroflexota bacterium]
MLLILFCGFLGGQLLAQTADTATIRGSVVDADQTPIVGARIAVHNDRSGETRVVESSAAGRFSLAGLSANGEYSVSATYTGFAEADQHHVVLAAGSSAVLQLTLRVAGETSTVNVEGVATDLRVDQPQLGILLTGQQAQNMPVPSRRITYLPLLDSANHPAINQGDIFMNEFLFTTNGAGRRQALFVVDGASAIEMWGRQTIFTNVPLMAVDQMAILTNAFSAEHGASTGSVVNIVTRSGGDHLHGQLLELWRPAAAQAQLAGFTSSTATSGNQITRDILGQTAALLSGSIGAAHALHFFTAAEYNREAKASPITSPLAPGSYVGHYRGWLGLVRLDRQLGTKNNVFLRANLDSFSDTNPNGIVGGSNLANVARVFRRRTYSGVAGETAVLGGSLVNNARLQFQLASPVTEFDPVIYSTQFVVPISFGGTFTSGTSQSALLMNRQYEFSDTVAAALGKHQVTAGASVIAAHSGGNSKEFGGPIFLGRFTYNTCTQAANICESNAYLNNIANVANYQQSFGNANYLVDDQLWALFVQDDFSIFRRVTLNAGMRYERQSLTDAKLNFAPRVGFVFDTRGNGSTVVRGGLGMYYSQIVDNGVASYALGEPTGVFTYTAQCYPTPTSTAQVGCPSSIAASPLPAFPAGAVAPIRSLYVRPGQPKYLSPWFPTSILKGYPGAMLNPYSEQYTASLEQQLGRKWILSVDYIGTHTLRMIRPLDVNSPSPFTRTITGTGVVKLDSNYEPIPGTGNVRTAQQANCSRPYWTYWYAQRNLACDASGKQGTTQSVATPPYSVIQTDVNDGYLHYDALDLNLRHSLSRGFTMLASYTWSHTLDNVDPDTTSQNPNDANFTQHEEHGPAIYDQRHRLVLSGEYRAPFKIEVGGIGTVASGLPFNIVTGTNNSGNTGATTDRPVVNGAVIGRNAGRGKAIYSFDPSISRAFSVAHDAMQFQLRAEAFNVFNHANFVGYSGTYGNGTAPGIGFGSPTYGVTSQLPARFMQFSAQVSF